MPTHLFCIVLDAGLHRPRAAVSGLSLNYRDVAITIETSYNFMWNFMIKSITGRVA